MANNRDRKWNLSRSGAPGSKSNSDCDFATIQWSNQGEFKSRIEIDLLNPSQGALYSSVGDDLKTSLFGVGGLNTQTAEQLDPYSRANDLIIDYPVSGTRPVGAELYWRWAEFPDVSEKTGEDAGASNVAEDGEQVSTLELIYSLQTDLLDTQPNPTITSILAGSSKTFFNTDDSLRLVEVAEGSTSKAQACIFRTQDKERGILIAVMPTDLNSMKAIELDDGRIKLEFELNSNFLEKGVIRRLRVFAAFAFGKSNGTLLEAANHFLSSEIPLTA